MGSDAPDSIAPRGECLFHSQCGFVLTGESASGVQGEVLWAWKDMGIIRWLICLHI